MWRRWQSWWEINPRVEVATRLVPFPYLAVVGAKEAVTIAIVIIYARARIVVPSATYLLCHPAGFQACAFIAKCLALGDARAPSSSAPANPRANETILWAAIAGGADAVLEVCHRSGRRREQNEKLHDE